MNDDELDQRIDEAAAAYAAHTARRGEHAGDTRERILASHRARRSQRERLTQWLAAAIVLLAVLGGSTVWAYWTGRLSSPTAPPATTSAIAPAPLTPHPALPATIVPATIVPEQVVPEPLTPEPLAPEPLAPTTPARAPSVSSVMESAAHDDAPAEGDVDPAERLAYRRAHGLHFDAHDAAGALEAWDGYLARYPHGRFALEARYNRAICLVRLDRRSEAEEALAPFARGTHGDYRRREASALIEALESE